MKESNKASIYTSRAGFKWVVLAISIFISGGSVIYTNILVKQIREREKKQINLYASTLEYLANENDAVNLFLILENIIQANNTIPVILADQNGNPEFYKNLTKADKIDNPKERKLFLEEEIQAMKDERDPIVVTLSDQENHIYGYKYIYYRNSILLVQLKYYPYVQLSIITIFALITFTVFNYSRTAEQNRVWVGLAKETAHQLGTPLSSLMAWVEYLKMNYPDDEQVYNELTKDVDRLRMITERFSSIGSVPQLKEENICHHVREVTTYLERRISTKVSMEIETVPNDQIFARINSSLFAWVIENLIKNAVDSMEGKGHIHLRIVRGKDKQVIIDLTDTGKGIQKSNINQIFKPGFTTKKRGWGLGLALTKRIVENYHNGRIFVQSTEVGRGTTFRIVLKS